MKRLLGFLFLLIAAPALANDSTAELATGGLKFLTNADIEMRSEDLFVSLTQIRVRYHFFNTSQKDITTLVAFPMPDITIDNNDDVLIIPTDDPENFLGFHTTANGQAVPVRVEQKAFAQGIERTVLLRRLHVPLHPRAANAALDRLPHELWDELIKLGLAEISEFDVGKGPEQHLVARWTLKSTYYWQQTFPAGQELVIDHRYTPSVGSSVETPLGEDWAKENDTESRYEQRYCPDPKLMAAIEKATNAAKEAQTIPFSEQRIEYILKTGANWEGPIKDFTLTVDKGDAKNIVSFCGDGIKKISPTQFQLHATDFMPTQDLYVLFLTKPPS